MTLSNTKRMINELSALETEAASIISREHCYILKIKLSGGNLDTLAINKIAEQLLLSEPTPSSVYYSRDIILLIFSAAIEIGNSDNTYSEHQLSGNHNLIVSRYCIMLSRLLGSKLTETNVTIQIVHLQSKTRAFSYLSYIIFSEYQAVIMRLSGGKITNKELNFRTESELILFLHSNCNINIEDVDKEEKYGVLMRTKRVKNKVCYLKMSEPFDATDAKKYVTFMFG